MYVKKKAIQIQKANFVAKETFKKAYIVLNVAKKDMVVPTVIFANIINHQFIKKN